jgi:hypothetical protein
MMTDRYFHNGARNSLFFHAQRENQYFYIFKGQTLNVLPIDPIWKNRYGPMKDEQGNNAFKRLGIAHGDDVRTLNEKSSY